MASIDSTLKLARGACLIQSTCTESGAFQSIGVQGDTVSMLGIWPSGSANGLGRLINAPDMDIAYTNGNIVTFTTADLCTVGYRHPLHQREPSRSGDDSCE